MTTMDLGVYQKKPGGRWHVAQRWLNGEWHRSTTIGYRTRERAQKRANRIAQRHNDYEYYRKARGLKAEAESNKISDRIQDSQ